MVTRFFGSADPPAEPIATTQPGSGSTAPAPADERRVALLVGNARYAQGKLANPVNDVRLIGKVLQALGFDVTVVEDVHKPALQAAVVAFCLRLEQAGPGAVALFYFAGHGIQHQGSNFLLPVGVDIPSTRFLPALAMPADEIVVELTRARRKANVIILDACRNNALPGLEGESRDLMQGLAALKLPPDGVLVAYSTAAGAVAEDGDGRHSPYAEALAQALPGLLESGRRLHDVFVEAAERVKEATGARQSPALYLQGTLPPLAVDEADRERFRTWVFYEPAWPWRRILQWGGGGLAATAAASLVVAWIAAYPETRGLWLHKAGIAPSDAFDFACAPPWDKPDRYSLTRADWCTDATSGLVKKVKQGGRWDEEVVPGSAASDPKAMVLAAGDIWVRDPARASPDRARMIDLALRAGRNGLPAAWLLLNYDAQRIRTWGVLATEQDALIEAEAKRRIRDAAETGVSSAQRALGHEAIREKDVGRAEEWMARADVTDPFGLAAAELGHAFAEFSYPDALPRDMAKAKHWLTVAALKGHALAWEQLIALAANRAIALSDAEKTALADRIIAQGGPLAALIEGRRLLELGPARDVAGAVRQLTIAAEAGNLAALHNLAGIYRDGLLDGKPDPAKALSWLERLADEGYAAERVRLATAYANGLPDRDGRPLIPPDPEKARAHLLRVARSSDAKVALAALHERGAFGKRDPAAAEPLYQEVADTAVGDEPTGLTARNGLQRIRTERRANAMRHVDEIARGSPGGALSFILYMPIGCDRCWAAYRRLIDPKVERLIDAGLARLVFREANPEGDGAPNEEASLIARCVAPEQRLKLVELFMERYDQWGRIEDRGERVAQLERLAAPFAIAPDAMVACLANDARRDGLRAQSGTIVSEFGVNQVPMIIVNGQIVVRPTPSQFVEVVLAMLPAQLLIRLTGRTRDL